MSKITALRINKSNSKRVSLYLDGKFAVSAGREDILSQRLRVGQEFSPDQMKELLNNLGVAQCLNTAYRFLSYRPRSEAEMRERLIKRGFGDTQLEIVINKLKEQNLLDDTAFVRFWNDNRKTFRPRSQRLTRMELKKKGVADEIIDEVVDEADDTESAYRAALRKAPSLAHQEFEVFRRRLGDYLKRRGFSYAVINQTVKRVWYELTEQSI